MGIKSKNDRNKIRSSSNIEAVCNQNSDDILFEFGHMTRLKDYSIDALVENADKKTFKNFKDLIQNISSATWLELLSRNKKQLGGFETLPLQAFNNVIWDNLDLSGDVKLHVFLFGDAKRYRMVGYKSTNCNRVFHVLGFDLDFSLYDHGN